MAPGEVDAAPRVRPPLRDGQGTVHHPETDAEEIRDRPCDGLDDLIEYGRPVKLIDAAVPAAMEKQHPVEAAGWQKWINRGEARVIEPSNAT